MMPDYEEQFIVFTMMDFERLIDSHPISELMSVLSQNAKQQLANYFVGDLSSTKQTVWQD